MADRIVVMRAGRLELVPAGTEGAITVQVGAVESTGTAMFVAGRAGELEVHALFSDRPAVRRGDTVGLLPKPGFGHVFDADTGLRI